MRAGTKNGHADAWSTLTISFDDDAGLFTASVFTEPEPAVVCLFASGLVEAWAGRHLRRK